MTTYRLQRLQLENFRGYRTLDLDLSADVTIIYGRNGIGKTAIFDAIEYLLTGGLGRFERYNSDPVLYLRHVLAKGERTLARLDLQSSDDSAPWLQVEAPPNQDTFRFASNPSGNLNTFLFKTLGDPEKLPVRQEIGVVADLIRSSIMLSQDSLREFIEADGARRKPMLANLSGLGFYERCVEKIAQVINTGERRRRDLASVLDELEQAQTTLASQLADEQQLLAAMADPEEGTPAPAAEEARSRFAHLGGQWPSSNLPLPDAAEAAQVFCRSRLRELIQRHGEMQGLRTVLPVLREQESRYRSLMAELQERRTAIATALTQEVTEQKTLDDLRQKRDLSLRAVGTIDAIFGNLRLLEDTLAADDDLFQREAQVRTARDEAERAYETARQTSAAAVSHANDLDIRFDRLEATVVNYATRIGKLRTVRDEIIAFEARKSSAGDLVSARQEIEVRRLADLAEATRLEDTIATSHARLEQLVEALSENVAARGELGRLAEIARRQVTSGDCPLCGHDHGSVAALYHAMDHVLATGSTTTDRLREEEQIKRQSLGQEQKRLEELKAKIVAGGRAVARVDLLTNELNTVHNALVARAEDLTLASVDIGVLTDALTAAEQAYAKSQAERQTLGVERANFAPVRTETETRLVHAERAAVSTRAALSNFAGQRTENAATRTRLLNSLPGFDQTDPSELRRAVVETVAAREQERQQARMRADTVEAQLAEGERRQRASAALRQTLNREIAARELEAADCTARVTEYTERFRAANVPLGPAEVALDQAIAALQAKREETLAVSTLLGRVEREARRTTVRERCDHLEREKAALDVKLGIEKANDQQISAAIVQAHGWQELLRPALDDVVAHHLEQHRREAFQLFKSLVPNAYQFTDVAVLPSATGDAVDLSLCFRGVAGIGSGEPRFFLSGAQSNALALSFFLSFTRRQQWCRLRALLLDDPVQHLDDLDAVALLDLLREVTLVREGPAQRQMVLSTCDLNLYHLALRKFAALDPEKIRLRAYTIVDGKGDRNPEAILDWPSQNREQVAA